MNKKPTDHDEYIAGFTGEVKEKLLEIRAIIQKAAPKAEEVISYNMPAFKQHKALVFYAAAKQHLGFYPTPAPIVAFKNELKDYVTSKGAIQFPLDRPLPKKLIQDIVKFRIKEDQEMAQSKKKK